MKKIIRELRFLIRIPSVAFMFGAIFGLLYTVMMVCHGLSLAEQTIDVRAVCGRK